MKEYSSYATKLETIAEKLLADPTSAASLSKEIASALNGGPSKVLRKNVPIDDLKRTGTFFTGEHLIRFVSRSLHAGSPINAALDPACGVGDLLLLASRSLPVFNDLRKTFGIWGNHLSGYDIHPEFVRTTKARLVLSAFNGKKLFKPAIGLSLVDLFPNIVTANGLDATADYSSASRILMNPPFHKVSPPSGTEWAGGKVSAAAVFVEQCLLRAAAGTKVVAILPDVLRSGSLYTRWRTRIESLATVEKIEVFGQFDSLTDISVFVLSLTTRNTDVDPIHAAWWPDVSVKNESIEDYFDVCVGPVVPYRDPKKGPRYPYVQPKGLPRWKTITETGENRRYSGTTIRGPFVVVRRNSRFEDKHRAVATLVNMREQVAVENHLIVLKPKDGLLKTCKQLMKILQRPETDTWLNDRIRCRHLTTSSVKALPWS